MIALQGVAAHRKPLSLASVSLDWGPGVHAVVGRREDGGILLFALIAGAARPRSGRVTVLGGAAHDVPVRTQVGVVLLDSRLPDALRVDETLALAAALRGEGASDPVERLRVLGVEALARRPVGSLSLPEARAVALAEAVTSSRVRVLLVEEPFLSVDPRAAALLPDRLRVRGAEGWAVVVLTASLREAGEIADDHVLLRKGAVTASATAVENLSRTSPLGARLRVVARDANDARALIAALARETEVDSISQDGPSVVARGRDALALARCVGQSIAGANLDVIEVRLDPAVDGEAPSREAPA